MGRFPRRTLILMILALLAFVWMWWRTHRLPSRREPFEVVPVKPVPKPPR
jgi:hypothetical protein